MNTIDTINSTAVGQTGIVRVSTASANAYPVINGMRLVISDSPLSKNTVNVGFDKSSISFRVKYSTVNIIVAKTIIKPLPKNIDPLVVEV